MPRFTGMRIQSPAPPSLLPSLTFNVVSKWHCSSGRARTARWPGRPAGGAAHTRILPGRRGRSRGTAEPVAAHQTPAPGAVRLRDGQLILNARVTPHPGSEASSLGEGPPLPSPRGQGRWQGGRARRGLQRGRAQALISRLLPGRDRALPKTLGFGHCMTSDSGGAPPGPPLLRGGRVPCPAHMAGIWGPRAGRRRFRHSRAWGCRPRRLPCPASRARDTPAAPTARSCPAARKSYTGSCGAAASRDLSRAASRPAPTPAPPG